MKELSEIRAQSSADVQINLDLMERVSETRYRCTLLEREYADVVAEVHLLERTCNHLETHFSVLKDAMLSAEVAMAKLIGCLGTFQTMPENGTFNDTASNLVTPARKLPRANSTPSTYVSLIPSPPDEASVQQSPKSDSFLRGPGRHALRRRTMVDISSSSNP